MIHCRSWPEAQIRAFSYALKHSHPGTSSTACPKVIRGPRSRHLAQHSEEEDKYALSSPRLAELPLCQHLAPKNPYRQKNHIFITRLQKCRLGIPSSQTDIKALTDTKPSICSDEALKIFPLRADVRRTNQAAAFQKLNSPAITFECQDHF
ncbi:hypothetical protein QBC42DRAFT_289661 [Cladorrhinum samala]|uniref:Uncharacterized protein n=1 Tax=Cladorrhinum samala TaxID=585594 RepID=A0AAV9HHE4_9PEZI|nr:hypothetical protein QBC42DRAFT_289661 [Cladorrhinum samala]